MRVFCSYCNCARVIRSELHRGLRDHYVRGVTSRVVRDAQRYSTMEQSPIQGTNSADISDPVPSPPNQDNPLSHPDLFGVEKMTSLRVLFEARVHLGHKTGTWNPLMKPYIYGIRAGMHILDLDKSQEHLRRALNVTGHVAYRNGVILFVNERPQFERIVQQAARECGEYFVAQKWRPGTLTNSYMQLRTLRLPDLVIFLSVPPSNTAIKEVAMCCIPSVGVVDSDCDPRLITYPVPGNDDTPSAVRLYCWLFSQVINRAKEMKELEEQDK